MGVLIRVAARNYVGPGKAIAVEPAGQRIAVFNVDGTYYALGDTCTHRGGPLSEGKVKETTVTCPWHGAQYDLRTGNVLSPPAPQGVRNYRVVVEDDDIKIEI